MDYQNILYSSKGFGKVSYVLDSADLNQLSM